MAHAHAHVRALTRSPGAEEALEQLRRGGQVLSRFARLANLEADGGRLVALHPPAVPSTPFSVTVDAVPAAGWPDAGAAVRLDGGDLWVGGVQVDLAGLRCLPAASPAPLLAACDPASALAALEPFVAESAFGRGPLAPSPAPPRSAAEAFQRRALYGLARLAAAARADDLPAVVDAAEGLLGLGPGGTPSGDDALVGFLGAWLRLSPEPGPARQVASRLAALAPSRTTRLAAEFHYHLARGGLSQSLEALLAAIARAEPPAIRAAAEALAGYGATSGRDTIAGVYASLQAWHQDEPGVRSAELAPGSAIGGSVPFQPWQ